MRSAPPGATGYGISASVVTQALETGRVVTSPPDPAAETGPSPARTREPGAEHRLRAAALAASRQPGRAIPDALGVVYVDNAGSAEPFSSDALRAAEALARHAALAIENAQLFEREQHTIEELRKTQKQLLQSEKLATIGQMAAGIAHELNTPLTYILGNLELLGLQELSAGAARDDCRRRPRRRADPLPGAPAARLQPARARGDGPAGRERRGRAQPRAVPATRSPAG